MRLGYRLDLDHDRRHNAGAKRLSRCRKLVGARLDKDDLADVGGFAVGCLKTLEG